MNKPRILVSHKFFLKGFFICSLCTFGNNSVLAKSLDFNSDPNMAMVSTEVKKICLQIQNKILPVEAQVTANAVKPSCDALNYYYGFDNNPNFVKARECAYLHKNYPVLTMIYANGKGTARNWDLALYYACRSGFAPAEIEGRVNHLTQLMHKNTNNFVFDMCDDVTSGYMMGQCAAIKERLQQSKRQIKLAKLTAHWNEQEQQALKTLKAATENFFKVRLDNEVDLSGSAREALLIEEREILEDNWLSSLEELNKNHFPEFDQAQYQQKDRELNQIYKKILSQKDFTAGTVNQKGIKRTQQAWVQYKNAWVVYGKNRYPQVSADSWQAWLTEQRIKMLQEFIDE